MAVRLNENKEIVEHVKRGLKEKDGYDEPHQFLPQS